MTAFGKRLARRLAVAIGLFAGSPLVLFGATALAAASPQMERDDWFDIQVFGIVAPFTLIGMTAGVVVLSLALLTPSPTLTRRSSRLVRIAPFAIAAAVGIASCARQELPFYQAWGLLVHGSIALFVSGIIAGVALMIMDQRNDPTSPCTVRAGAARP